MAKAKKTDTSTDQLKDAATEVSEDIIDAEILEETSATEETNDVTPDDVDGVDLQEPTADSVEDAPQEIADETEAADATEEDASETAELAEEAAVAEEVTPPPAAAPVKKVGFMPVVFGGVIAGALGFGASQYVGPMFAQKDDALVQLEAVVKEQSSQIEALLAAQSTAAETADATQSSTTAIGQSVEEMSGSLTALNGRIDDAAQALVKLDGRIATLEKNPITQSLPSSAIEAYERELEDLKAVVTAQRDEAASMEENAKISAQQALARAALSRVQSALDSGASYRTALSDLSSATGFAIADVLEVNADEGVPTLAALQDQFPEAARVALAKSRETLSDDENRLTSFFKAQLGARSVTPQAGDDADAVLSRAEDALRNGHVTDALAELGTLPDAAKSEMAAWVSIAETRQAAFAAGEALSQQLNAN